MKRKRRIPKWVEAAPQTPLEIKLKGRRYQHHVWCNVGISGRIPIGGPGCICLRMLGEI